MEGLVFADDAQKKAFEAVLANQQNLETHSRRYLRREEGTKLAQAKETAERAAEQAKREAQERIKSEDDFHASLTTWQQEEKQRLQVEAKGEIDRFKATLKASGVDPDSILGQQMQQQNLQQAQQQGLQREFNGQPDYTESDKRYLDMGTARTIASTAIDLPLKMPVIMDRVKKLYGDAPVDWKLFQETAKANLIKGIDVDDTAEAIFKFSEKQKEQDTAALRAQITSELESQFQERLAKLNIPGAASPAYVDPNDSIFKPEFADKTKISDATQDAAAKEDFLRVHAELAAKGVEMMQ